MKLSNKTFMAATVFSLCLPLYGYANLNAHVDLVFAHDKQQSAVKDEAIRLIKDAHKTIDISSYLLKNDNVVRALIDARCKRNVAIRIILDKNADQKNHQLASGILANRGFVVRTNNNYKQMNMRFMIIDDQFIQTGSWSYGFVKAFETEASKKETAENAVLISEAPELAHQFSAQFENLWQESGKDVVPLDPKNCR